MYQIKLTRQAEKAFAALMKAQPAMGRRVAQAIDHLGANPGAGIPLRAELKGLYKYRVGVYRIIYSFQRRVLLVTIIDIGHRKEVYR
ncbi:MAG: type II toxin-antitoxin system RelE/ParE family toxin [Deltaproteobacteria bacterium]|nr:type II toxin-antitoxin system RelE/ParE family toxin [Deltaproteobacteria bacterium]